MTLFRRVVGVSEEVLAAHGGENPFSSMRALKHHLAYCVGSLGTNEDPAFLWHATPSKLIATGKTRIIKYDTQIGEASLAQPLQQGQETANHVGQCVCRKDAFVDCFLTLYGNSLVDGLLQSLSLELQKKDHVVPDQTLLPPCFKCANIVLMRGYVFQFFKNQGSTSGCSLGGLETETAEFSLNVWPSLAKRKTYLQEHRKHFRINTVAWIKLRSETTINTYDALWERFKIIMQNNKDPDEELEREQLHIYRLATRTLRPPSELKNAANIMEASLPLDQMEPCDKAMHAIQEQAVDEDNHALATMVLATTGAFSDAYLNHIKCLRAQLNALTENVHTAEPTPTSAAEKAAVAEAVAFVSRYRLGSKQAFDFHKPDEKKTK